MAQKLERNTIEKIEGMRRCGHSYKEIASISRISVSTSHKYAKEIGISDRGKRRLENRITWNQRRFTDKFSRIKPIRIKHKQLTLVKARIIGHCMFDGSVDHYTVRYTNTSLELLHEFIDDMAQEYGIAPTSVTVIKKRRLPYFTATFCSKVVCADLLKYVPCYISDSPQCKIPAEIFSSGRDTKKEFLRAFWEDEGSVDIYGEIRAKIKNRVLRDQLISLHNEFQIECNPYSEKDGSSGIYIPNHPSNIRQFKEVTFRKSVVARGKSVGGKKYERFLKIYKTHLNQIA
jgi:hypothetical protein